MSENERCAVCGWCIHKDCGILLQKYRDIVIKRKFSKICLRCMKKNNWNRSIKKGTKNPTISTQLTEIRKNINTKTGTIMLKKAVKIPVKFKLKNCSQSNERIKNLLTSKNDNLSLFITSILKNCRSVHFNCQSWFKCLDGVYLKTLRK